MRCWRGVRSLVHDRISSFPEGWEQALLGDIVQILDHHRVPVNADERALRVGVYPYYGANGQAGTIDSFLFDGDFALLAEDGGNFDDSTKGVAYRVMGKFWVNNHAHILAPQGGMSTQFLVYALNALNWMPHVSGTTRLKLTQGSLKKVPLSIPSLPEQRRIVAKIEALQERSCKARAALEAIPPLLEQFRQSVLAAAFRGDLTADWRAQHPDVEPASVLLDRIRADRRRRWEEAELAKMQAKGKMPKDEKWKERYKEPEPVDETDLPELPERWCYTKIEPLLSLSRPGIKTGPFGSLLKKHEHCSDGVPVLGIENIESMVFQYGSKIHIAPEKALELGDYDIQPKDLIISCSGTVGEICIIPDDIGTARFSTNIMRVVLHSEGMLPEFLGYLFLGSPYVRKQISEACYGSTRDFLNKNILEGLLLPLPPYREQKVIIELLQQSLQNTSLFQKNMDEVADQLRELDQSILAKAFRGELVPQDPNDEPASVLLERIRAEREAQSAKPRAKKKTQGSTKHTKKAPPVSVNENDDLPLFNSLQK